jgi:hypothetical protein
MSGDLLDKLRWLLLATCRDALDNGKPLPTAPDWALAGDQAAVYRAMVDHGLDWINGVYDGAVNNQAKAIESVMVEAHAHQFRPVLDRLKAATVAAIHAEAERKKTTKGKLEALSRAEAIEATGAPPSEIVDAVAEHNKRLDGILDANRWNPNTKKTFPPPIAKFAGRVSLRRGNISVNAGKSGAGKSSFIGALVAALWGSNGDCLGWERCETGPRGAVVAFDYEQSEQDFTELCHRVQSLAGVPKPDWFTAYRLRDYSLNDRKAATALGIARAQDACGGVDLVILDGGSDLIEDVNDPKRAPELVGEWLALSSQYNCHILIVIHLNESNQAGIDPRGWLGKEALRKCEAQFALSSEAGQTKVHTHKHRKAGISKDCAFAFEWNEEKQCHVSVGIVESDAAAKSHHERQEWLGLIDAVFQSKAGGLRHNNLKAVIMETEGCSDGKAKGLISKMTTAGLLMKGMGYYCPTSAAMDEISKAKSHEN